LIYNTKISDNNAESGKVPRMLAAFPRWMAKKEFLWFWIAWFRDKSVSDDIKEIDGFFAPRAIVLKYSAHKE
jgi:hypothetical protein